MLPNAFGNLDVLNNERIEMNEINLTIPHIPHGHGLSFKRGIADGLLDSIENKGKPHPTHMASYQRGVEIGRNLRELIAPLVAD